MRSIEEINALSPGAFIELLGAIFEHSPWVAAQVAGRRPFENQAALYEAMCGAVARAPSEQQLALIRAHPDLVGRATLTRESQAEQTDAGLMELTPAEVSVFSQYNAEYKARFGFPFVICARLNKKEAILAAFPRRLANSIEEEHRQALEEIYMIARIRLQMLIS